MSISGFREGGKEGDSASLTIPRGETHGTIRKDMLLGFYHVNTVTSQTKGRRKRRAFERRFRNRDKEGCGPLRTRSQLMIQAAEAA
jgi:hypothetical protein